MQNAFVVRGSESGTELSGNLERFVRRQTSDAAQQRMEILAVHVFH